MEAQGETGVYAGDRRDAYARVISGIQKNPTATISVPQISRLLGVKPTTLNARFRRQRTRLKTVGRTTFMPIDLALHLAALHRYALLGWPTLQQASVLTGVKSGTIKAKCEKGQLEGHIDLTKRLRVNPCDLEHLRMQPLQPPTCKTTKQAALPRINAKEQSPHLNGKSGGRVQQAEPIILAPAPEPHIKVVKAEDYGYAEPEERVEVRVATPGARNGKHKLSDPLDYDPDRPFSVAQCRVGQSIKYGQYEGTIVKIMDDPFSPRILAKFPDHQHPLMREVLLIVERRKA